ncbi:histone [Labeo rohita]|uniref:Histone n=1 Tax=Labeo rohita TaxID=84645 RepID=A0A498L8Z3_LABRO|nr:histone [Labeo rohita]
MLQIRTTSNLYRKKTLSTSVNAQASHDSASRWISELPSKLWTSTVTNMQIKTSNLYRKKTLSTSVNAQASHDSASRWISELPSKGITKPAIRRLARRGGVKRISGLIYEETVEGVFGERDS